MTRNPDERGYEPEPNSRSCPRILAAVAAALPETISLRETNTWPNADRKPSSIQRHRQPGLATRRRFCNRSIISSPPHVGDLHLLFVNRKLRCEPRGGLRRIAQRSSQYGQ